MPFGGVQSEFYNITLGVARSADIPYFLLLQSRLDYFCFCNVRISTCRSQVSDLCFHPLNTALQFAVLMCSDTLLVVYF